MSGLSARDRSRLMVVAAALLWSTSGFYAKAPWFDDWPIETRGVALTFWRTVFAALTVLPFVRRPTFRIAMIPMSLSFVAMTYSFLGRDGEWFGNDNDLAAVRRPGLGRHRRSDRFG